MKHHSPETMRKDRKRLRAALGDFATGGFTHLATAEREQFVESIKYRIAYLNAQIERFDDA
jgi:c-di-GMP-binding flagellar brake protein YcgR